MIARGFSVWLHRWVGLAMEGFLIVVGLTGSMLAFNIELERVFAPQLFASGRPGSARLGLGAIAERAQALVPQGRVVLIAHTAPDQTKVVFEPREDPQLILQGETATERDPRRLQSNGQPQFLPQRRTSARRATRHQSERELQVLIKSPVIESPDRRLH